MICGLPALEVARVRVLGADQKKKLTLGTRLKRPLPSPLPWVEAHCVEHARRLLSDRILT